MSKTYIIVKCTLKGHLFFAGLQNSQFPLISNDIQDAIVFDDKKIADEVAKKINRDAIYGSDWHVNGGPEEENELPLLDKCLIPGTEWTFAMEDSETGNVYEADINNHALMEVKTETDIFYVDIDAKNKCIHVQEPYEERGDIVLREIATFDESQVKSAIKFPEHGFPPMQQIVNEVIFAYIKHQNEHTFMDNDFDDEEYDEDESAYKYYDETLCRKELQEHFGVTDNAIKRVGYAEYEVMTETGKPPVLVEKNENASDEPVWVYSEDEIEYAVLEASIKVNGGKKNSTSLKAKDYFKDNRAINELFFKRGDLVFSSKNYEDALEYFYKHEPEYMRVVKHSHNFYTISGAMIIRCGWEREINGNRLRWRWKDCYLGNPAYKMSDLEE